MKQKFKTHEKRGLYQHETKDSCGVGFVSQLNIPPSHKVVKLALKSLTRLTHRGGVDADGISGDGAGILTQLPQAFFIEEAQKLDIKF